MSKVNAKKLNLTRRNMLISWGIYAVVLFAVAIGYKLRNFKMSGMNCFQDEFITFALYMLYYLPNKNIIYDNLYVYPRLKSDKNVFLYYLKIYLKSSLIYFAGINIINLVYCLIAWEHIYWGALVMYVLYGYASFMVLHLLSAVLLTKWNAKYISVITTVFLCVTYLLNLIIPKFYFIGFIFYNLSTPYSEGCVPVTFAALTYSVCLLIISALWIIPGKDHGKAVKIRINFKRYLPLYLIALPSAFACVMYDSVADFYDKKCFSFFMNILSYNYNFLIKYDMSNVELQLVIMAAGILCLCSFFIISEKYEERKLL